MRILLIDSTLHEPVSPLFLDAIRGLGCEYRFMDEGPFLQPLEKSLIHKIAYRLLHRRPPTYWAFNRTLLEEARRFHPHLMLAVKSPYIMPGVLRRIKEETGALLVNYATDDPFNKVNSTPDLIRGIPCYELYASTKRAIMVDIRRAGCPHVAYVRFGYKPSVHFPEFPATESEAKRFQSDVVLIGGADNDRLPYVEAISRLGDVSLALYGGYWTQYNHLRRYARGFAVGRDYRLALGGAKIALCLVRRANRDGHAMRTFEIPACGAFMLAERTDEHLELFKEDQHAAFFGSPEELLEKVRYYLVHEQVRQNIATAGHERVTTGAHTYRDRLMEILEIAGAIEHPFSSIMARTLSLTPAGRSKDTRSTHQEDHQP